jgi:hypothetical protein
MLARRIRGGPGVSGYRAAFVALALAAALHVAPARASEEDDLTAEGWKKVLSFGRCAFHVFRAITPVDWMVAFIDCSRLFLEEPPFPGGGQP